MKQREQSWKDQGSETMTSACSRGSVLRRLQWMERDCFQFPCSSTRELNSIEGASNWPSLGHMPALIPPHKDLLCFAVQHPHLFLIPSPSRISLYSAKELSLLFFSMFLLRRYNARN